MTVAPPPPAPPAEPAPAESAPAEPSATRTRSRAAGIFLVVLGAATALLFGRGTDGALETTFGLNPKDPTIKIPDLTVPTAGFAYAIGLVLVVLGAIQLARGFGGWTGLVLAIAIVAFVLAFLGWAARGESFSLLGMLQSTILRATPLALGAFAGVLCERSGVVNIAIEGMMLTAAFTGAFAASVFDNLYLGTLCGVAVGGLLGAFLAGLSIRYRMDQIVGGTVINILAVGLTSYLAARLFSEYPDLNDPGTFRDWPIPILSDIPFIGPLFFDTSPFVYVMVALTVVLTIALFRTRWGLRTRAVGEHPRAADTVGIDVLRMRFRNVILGGMCAGLAGSFLTLGSVGRFEEEMTAGRGFIALAALIVGRWHPVGALGAALIFGFAESLQIKIALFDQPIPSEFLLMAPYVATLVVVAGFIGRSRPPAADGQPYEKSS